MEELVPEKGQDGGAGVPDSLAIAMMICHDVHVYMILGKAKQSRDGRTDRRMEGRSAGTGVLLLLLLLLLSSLLLLLLLLLLSLSLSHIAVAVVVVAAPTAASVRHARAWRSTRVALRRLSLPLSAFIRSSGRLRFGHWVGLHLLMYKTRACLLVTVPVLCVCAQRARGNVCIRICANEAFFPVSSDVWWVELRQSVDESIGGWRKKCILHIQGGGACVRR